MTGTNDRDDRLDSALAAGDPVAGGELDRLPVLHARNQLLEEIMTDTSPARRAAIHWLAPIGAAAAVAVLASGAWVATTGSDDPAPEPRGPGFAEDPGTGVGEPARSKDEGTGVTSGGYVLLCEDGAETPPGFDPATDPAPQGCQVHAADSDPGTEEEFYQRPLRPMLITADGWAPDRVAGYDITWTGPGGAEISTHWIVTAHPDDPWAYDKPGAVATDREVEVLGSRTRLGEYVRGEVKSFALTSGIYRDGTSIYFSSDTMDADALLAVIESAAWVSEDEFAAAVRPAAGE
ncbi:hypothetical protein HNR19_003701 [Nocardioides thalensis]|uniref:Uncharacterized protein n=1 Tax=Nocardioides thalensis TaxID=1914755 RepID=A0A853C9V8_9ACTN|nr:hypothetical protein [Nocardioides thalensis]NYJ03003.1 hypothetical protein [Nocardioides thalensis]